VKEIIVISAAEILLDEPAIWNKLFAAGLEKLHVRKPDLSAETVGNLLQKVGREYLSRIVIHYHPELAQQFNRAGVHYSYSDLKELCLNRSENSSISCSVHNWQEMDAIKDKANYCFISPVFDSISKQGYKQNETLWQLPDLAKTYPVYALGGVDLQNFEQVLNAGFYGFALLGSIWDAENPVQEFQNFQYKLQELKALKC